MHQFVLHASLDMVREKQFFTPSMYLGAVETFRDNVVSAWVMANGTSILLLNRGFPEASVKAFLKAVYQLALLHFLNPLGQRDAPIKTVAFEAKVFQAAAQVRFFFGLCVMPQD